jgi:adenylate cyclase
LVHRRRFPARRQIARPRDAKRFREIERSRRKHPENLDAYDLYLRAVPHMASVVPTDARVAAGLLEDALRLDRDYAAADALLAWCHEIFFARDGLNEADRGTGIRHARAAIADGGDDHTALAIAAFALGTLSKDYDAAAGPIERALSLNPSCAAPHYIGVIVYAFAGHPAAAIANANPALRLSPFDLRAPFAHGALGAAAIQEARYNEAAALTVSIVQR